MRFVLLLIASLLIPTVTVWAQDPTVEFSSDDPVMKDAVKEARATLPVFLEHAGADTGHAPAAYAVKVAVPIDDTGVNHEVIWVSPFMLSPDGGGRGELANEPQDLPGMKLGDTLVFTRDQIEDWGFEGPDGLLYGNYTTRALIPELDAENAAYILGLLPPEPIPQDWR